MKSKKLYSDERGIAHFGLIIVAAAVIAVGVFAFMRVDNANNSESKDIAASQQTEDSDNNVGSEEDEKSISDAGNASDNTQEQAAEQQETNDVSQ